MDTIITYGDEPLTVKYNRLHDLFEIDGVKITTEALSDLMRADGKAWLRFTRVGAEMRVEQRRFEHDALPERTDTGFDSDLLTPGELAMLHSKMPCGFFGPVEVFNEPALLLLTTICQQRRALAKAGVNR